MFGVLRGYCTIVGAILICNLLYVTLSVYIGTTSSAPSEGFLFGLNDESIDGLSAAQCTKQFPKLYHEVDRAVTFWKNRGHTISSTDINATWATDKEGTVRILIHDGELRILKSHLAQDAQYATRTFGILYLIQRALESAIAGGEKMPTIETTISLPDTINMDPNSDTTVWTVGRDLVNFVHERYWLIPSHEFFFDGTSSYRDTRRKMMEFDVAFNEKIPKVVWRGSAWGDHALRGGLLSATEGKMWSDVVSVEADDKEDFQQKRLKIEDMCKYAFTAHTEGLSYSRRLDFILNCQSLPIVHKLNWAVFYTHLLEADGPNQNYAHVQRNWTDLEATVEHYLNHPLEAEKVIANSLNTFRRKYLTTAARSCYIRKLIQGYSTVAFQPEPYLPAAALGEARRLRGVSFEEYMFNRTDGDFERGRSGA